MPDEPMTEEANLGIFLRVPEQLAEALPSLGEEDGSPAHATLLFIGQHSRETLGKVIGALGDAVQELEPFEVELEDYGEFVNDAGQTIAHLIPRSEPSLAGLHEMLKAAMASLEVETAHHEGPFKPHVTLAYVEPGQAPYSGPRPSGAWLVDALEVWHGDTRYSLPFAGPSAIELNEAVATTYGSSGSIAQEVGGKRKKIKPGPRDVDDPRLAEANVAMGALADAFKFSRLYPPSGPRGTFG